jgi:hypothetical protein
MNRPIPTPESIHEQIREAWLLYRMQVTRWDECVMYLGKVESAALDIYAERYIPGRVTEERMKGTAPRREYEGRPIFVVDAERHIGFGPRDL